ncbi:MAG: porin family protein [Hyphomicrobiales bacterium]
MKKILTITCFLLLVFLAKTSNAQYKSIILGFKAAPTVSWIKPESEGYKSTGAKIGFSWGLTSEFFIMENYSIQTGFNVAFQYGGLKYADRIYRDANNFEDGMLTRDYKFQYIQIPICLKMRTRSFNGFKFYGKIGLGTAIRIKAKADDQFVGSVTGQHDKEKNKDITNQTKLLKESLILGAGAEYNLGGSTSLIFGINFDNGFTDILKDQNKVNPDIDNKAIANYLEFNIGLTF